MVYVYSSLLSVDRLTDLDFLVSKAVFFAIEKSAAVYATKM